jgi:hypothetical protein
LIFESSSMLHSHHKARGGAAGERALARLVVAGGHKGKHIQFLNVVAER